MWVCTDLYFLVIPLGNSNVYIVLIITGNGYRTEWSTIQGVIEPI